MDELNGCFHNLTSRGMKTAEGVRVLGAKAERGKASRPSRVRHNSLCWEEDKQMDHFICLVSGFEELASLNDS